MKSNICRARRSQMHNQAESDRNQAKLEHVFDGEMIHITTQNIVRLVNTTTSPTPTLMQNQIILR